MQGTAANFALPSPQNGGNLPGALRSSDKMYSFQQPNLLPIIMKNRFGKKRGIYERISKQFLTSELELIGMKACSGVLIVILM